MATYTATQARAGVQPRGNHNGVDAVISDLNFADIASASAGDVVFFGKVSNGSTILAIQHSGAPTGNTFPITYTLDGSTLGSATAQSGGMIVDNRVPFTVSLSDEATPQHSVLTGIVGTIGTATQLGTLSVTMWLTRDPAAA